LAAELDTAVDELQRRTASGACDDDCGCTATTVHDSAHDAAVSVGRASVPDSEHPVACTLDATRCVERLDDWQAILKGAIATHRAQAGVRFQLAAGTDVARVAALAVAEQRCCSFLTFALLIDGAGGALEIRSTDDGAPILETFRELAS
jgi:hypothetical protein